MNASILFITPYIQNTYRYSVYEKNDYTDGEIEEMQEQLK